MDLCCLIDSDERLSASDMVTMFGDLLERGQSIFYVRVDVSFIAHRNKVQCQTSAPCEDTDRQTLS